ncbi:MAG: hypothetical protein LIP08_03770 [Bacteroides sp.]|nr:hypothetical protein [Bacteroides sp.]
MKATFNKSEIMRSAWSNFKRSNGTKTFAECLKSAWMFAKLQARMSGYTERANREYMKGVSVHSAKSTVYDHSWAAKAYETEKAIRGNGVYWGD